jgi:hypothetical protein
MRQEFTHWFAETFTVARSDHSSPRNICRLQSVGVDAERLGPSEVTVSSLLGPDSVSGAGPLFMEERVMLPQESLALSPKPAELSSKTKLQ